MNAVRRESRFEVNMGTAEATDAKIDALSTRTGETKEDVRELRKDMSSLRDKVDALRAETHAGFVALSASIASLDKNISAIHATMKTVVWGAGIVATGSLVFFSAAKALHWF